MSLFLVVIASCTCVFIGFQLIFKKTPPFPPGPPSIPLLGHLLSFPRSHQENTFYEWGKIYGDVIYLYAMGKSFVVLNSSQAATDLLDKRSNNYSERPDFPIFELMGWKPSLTLLSYGKQFQLHRKMMHQHLNRDQCVSYEPFQKRQAHLLVNRLLSDPERHEDAIGRFSTAIIIWVAYGHQIMSDDDWHFKIAKAASHALFETGPPGGTPVDIFPFLRNLPSWFPGTFYANLARSKRPTVRRLHEAPILKVQEQILNGEMHTSFAASQLEAMDQAGAESRITLHDVQGAAAILHVAGTDTTWATLSIFILAMLLHPECQTKAQAEIDTVIGCGRLPEFHDRGSLQYVECIFQETLRWHQAVPLGLPHRSLEDDIYNGMLIPKGSLVIANMRAMTLDDSVYTDPLNFNPDRFMPTSAGNGEPYPNIVFGWGRRICPGRHLADTTLWIAITSILATLTISKPKDKDGQEITPALQFSSGIVNQPIPYQCNIQPRSKASLVLLEEALACE